MNVLLRAVGAIALGLWSALATAASTFQIEEIYSNADGAVQYVVLHETAGADGQQAFAGGQLKITHKGFTKVFTFPADLPSSATADRRVLIASQGLAALGIVTPDYVFPNQFIATDGATLVLSGVDQVTYGPLPTDGVNAIDRTGAVTSNVATNFAGASFAIPPVPVTVIEYYDAVRDHYFVTALQPEIDALDLQVIPGWMRTGQSFGAYATLESAGPGAQPVCRFYIPPEDGNSHFFSASVAECAAILQLMLTNPLYAGYVYETAQAFFIGLPDLVTGACPIGTVAVYRLWNQRADSNHRYTTDPATKAAMIARGYAPEGYGPDAVSMCAPAQGPVDLALVGLRSIVWTGTRFVAVGGGPGAGGVILVSPDGLKWTVRSSGTPVLNAITWTGSQLIAVGAAGTILTSPDGYRWTAQASNAGADLNGVASAGTLFAAVGDGGLLLTSLDSVTWTPRVSKTLQNLNAVAWNGVRFVFVGDGGTILNMRDTDKVPSTLVSGTAEKLLSVAVADNGRIVIVGANGTILIGDGTNWQPRVSNTAATLQAVTAAGNQFVAVGANGRIVYSSSGNTWSVAQSRTAIPLSGVAASGTLFVAVGSSGTIVYSPDATLWTVEESP